MRMMPKISVRPTPRKNSRAACDSALTPWVRRNASVDMRPALTGSWRGHDPYRWRGRTRCPSVVIRHLVARWRRALGWQRCDDLGHRMGIPVPVGGFEDEALLDALVVALAHEHLALDVVDHHVLERWPQFVSLDAAGLGDAGLEHPLALPLLALGLVGHLPAVLLLPELDELLVLGVVDGEGVTGRSDDAKAGIAHGAHGR